MTVIIFLKIDNKPRLLPTTGAHREFGVDLKTPILFFHPKAFCQKSETGKVMLRQWRLARNSKAIQRDKGTGRHDSITNISKTTSPFVSLTPQE